MKSNASDAYASASRWLTRRDHSVHEMRQRLLASGQADAATEVVLEKLVSLHYLDDERLAQSWSERRAAQGYGPQRARAELSARGVAAALIDAAVTAAWPDEEQHARRLLQMRFPDGLETTRQRGRAARYLANRGFAEETVLAIVGEGC